MPEANDPLTPNPELQPLADALRGLEPATTVISRDRLLFEAGKAVATPPFSWLWPGSTAVFFCLSLVLGAFLIAAERRNPAVIERERIVEVRVPVKEEPPAPSPEPANEVKHVVPEEPGPSPEAVRMFQVRRDVLRWGADMLPPTRPSPATPPARATPGDLDRWLGVPPGTFAAPQPKAPPRLFPNILGDD